MAVGEEDMLNLSGKDWKPIPRIARTIPFGYTISPEDDKVLSPVIFELEALEQAKKHVRNGHSYRVVADWLTGITGRSISHNGLRKRLDIERRRTGKAAALKKWAANYLEALEKARETAERLGQDTTTLEAEIRALASKGAALPRNGD